MSCLFFASCFSLMGETIPETGRRRPTLRYSEAEMSVLGAEAYEEASEGYEVLRGTPEAEQVDRVGRRLAGATGKQYAWEFRLLAAQDMANAFCLPGGKIGVYTGMLEHTQNDDGLAVVLSHEIAHATLQHANERMSQPLLKQLIGLPTGIAVGVWGAISPLTRKVVMNGLGLGYLVGEVLPYSQQQELEADDVGLTYMLRAGYDLNEVPKFWRRMAELSDRKVTDMLSSHPDTSARADRLEKKIAAMTREADGDDDDDD